MRIPWLTWVWPILILLSTLAVTLTTFLFPAMGARSVVTMWFLFVIPGITVVRFFRLNSLVIECMFALVLSFTIDAFVAGGILYARQWSPTYIICFLIGFCFSGAIAQLAIIRSIPDKGELFPSNIEDMVTSNLAELRLFNIEEAVTSDLAKPQLSNIEKVVTNVKDPEDTQERTAVLPRLQQSRREDTQEKTAPLTKPELSGKEA